MKLNLLGKLCPVARLDALSRRYRAAGQRVVLCHGCFDIVHPGHIRYLQFARQQGDVLVVSLTGDDAIEKSDGTRPYIPQELRAEALAALEFVSHVVVASTPTAEPIIRTLRPDLYVKGKDYERSSHPGFLAEKALVESLGGRVMFSSGDVTFSSTTILDEIGGSLELEGFGPDSPLRLATLCSRWSLDAAGLERMLSVDFPRLRVAVVGDLICDRYVFCDAGEVSAEAPILSLRPVRETEYLGGAAIIAAHLRGFGAGVHLLSTRGGDAVSERMLAQLGERGIECSTWPTRAAVPVKERYVVDAQKVFKVDRASTQPLDSAVERSLLGQLFDLRHELDAVIFCEFGYGTVTQRLLSQAVPMLRPHVKTLAGDISGPQRTLLAMEDMDLLVPTERELRAVLGDFELSLPGLAVRLMRQLRLRHLAVTMGSRGCVLFQPREERREEWFRSRLRSEYVPALTSHTIDAVGAGDAFLAAATLALAVSGELNPAGYVGSLAAALAVERVGNQPIDRDAMLHRARSRPELQRERRAVRTFG